MSSDRPSGDFGATLRTARERRGISLQEIAGSTKIPIAALEALERNDLSRLPGGIFSRAFVRSYAGEVGLDPEAATQDFMAQFPQDTVAAAQPTPDPVPDQETHESDRGLSGRFLGVLIIGIPLATALVYFNSTERPAPAATTVVATPATEPPSRSSAPLVPEAPSPARSAATSDVSQPPVTPAADESFTVGLSVKRPCWVSATVDGHIAIERLLQPGDLRKIEVRREIVLTAGDAAAVTLTLNGAEARSLGKSGAVVTTRLNLTNFKGYMQSR